MNTLPEMIEAVKKHAKEHYSKGGWDNIVECWDDGLIEDELVACKTTTNQEAVEAVGRMASLYSEREDDVMCQSGEHEKCPRCGHWFYVERPCDCKED